MAVPYNHKAIEKKWKEKWAENPVNPKVDENGNPKKDVYKRQGNYSIHHNWVVPGSSLI